MGRNYKTITKVTDFGPFVTSIILDAGVELEGAKLNKDDFRVEIKRKKIGEDRPWPKLFGDRAPNFPMEGEMQVLDVSITDESGNKTPNGNHITLSILADPRNTLNSIVRFNGAFNALVRMEIIVTQIRDIICDKGVVKEGIYDADKGNRIIYGELLKEDIHDDLKCPLRYVYYTPMDIDKMKQDAKIPLIIWLHGGGEGGTDTIVSAIGNKVVNFISPQLQDIFGGMAYLLCPQCPTLWMDDGKGGILDTPDSIYVEPLENLISDFIKQHGDIDENRIYIGGDSNGGYMTIRMILNNPDRYAAGFPVCEGFRDEWITDEYEEILRNIPMWFTAAKNDTVLPVMDYAVPTYHRLKKRSAKVILTLFDKVVDTSGKYKNDDGTPYEYMGHWSWIPMLNNECRLDYDKKPVVKDGKEVTILEWVAACRKGNT